jgi:hypothetical protein
MLQQSLLYNYLQEKKINWQRFVVRSVLCLQRRACQQALAASSVQLVPVTPNQKIKNKTKKIIYKKIKKGRWDTIAGVPTGGLERERRLPATTIWMTFIVCTPFHGFWQ